MKTEIKIRLAIDSNDKSYQNMNDVEMKSVETNQCTELFVDHFLDYIPVESIMQALSIWKTKLRHGAKLIITSGDIVQISKAALTKTFKIPQINQLLFGEGNIGKRSCVGLEDVVTLLEHLELKIITKRISDNFTYTIIAERP